MNSPTKINIDQFKSHSSRHFITEELRYEIWGNTKHYNSHTFRIKKIFKEPIKYCSDEKSVSFGKFIKDVTIYNSEDVIVNKFSEILNAYKNISSETGSEDLKKLFEKLFELYLAKYSEKIANKKAEITNV